MQLKKKIILFAVQTTIFLAFSESKLFWRVNFIEKTLRKEPFL